MSFPCRNFLSLIIPITLISVSLSACGSIDSGENVRALKRSSTESSLAQVYRERPGLPSLALQMKWREQAMASNLSFNPQLTPAGVPRDFAQIPWSRELPLMAPRVEAILTSDFGWRGLYDKRDFHSGIDIAAAAGTVIYTPVRGEVLYVKHAGTDSGVVITDGQRQHTFWHTTPKRGLKRGDRLEKGFSVGTLVGWGSRTHLHYSVHLTGPSDSHKARNDGNAIDPLTLIRRLKQSIALARQDVPTGGPELTPHQSLMLDAARQPAPSQLARKLPQHHGALALVRGNGSDLGYRLEDLFGERP